VSNADNADAENAVGSNEDAGRQANPLYLWDSIIEIRLEIEGLGTRVLDDAND
jgi:hypothetical protein